MSWKRKVKFFIGVLLIACLMIPLQSEFVQEYLSIPNHITIDQHELVASAQEITDKETNYPFLSNIELHPSEINEDKVLYKVGNFPIKKVNINVLKNHEIVPGGQSIGVQLHTRGVLVVGHHLVSNMEKEKSPAEEANIMVGDIIVEMDGKKISNLTDIKDIVQTAGEKNKKIAIKLKRGKEYIETKLQPTYNKKEDAYQIGVYIRDSTTGIGTVSFYDRTTGKYGALGHVISDADTKKPIEIHHGKIVNSLITHIEKGNRGLPGEKQAEFSMNDEKLGTIEKNSPFGIFGKIDPKKLKDEQKPLPIGLAKDVKKGPAHILTVVEGDKVEKFDIEVVNSIPQTHPSTKGMIIKVTDQRLIDKTGGIVQGMSGSPIIQDGKLIGAVTHVFVNDPTSGYGVHIEWMLQEAEIDLYEEEGKQFAQAL